MGGHETKCGKRSRTYTTTGAPDFWSSTAEEGDHNEKMSQMNQLTTAVTSPHLGARAGYDGRTVTHEVKVAEPPTATRGCVPAHLKTPPNFSSPTTQSQLKRTSSYVMRIPQCQPFDFWTCKYLTTAMPDPPVTRDTLMELDLEWIWHNINLRADVNFDHALHFMPARGARDDQKREATRGYWQALVAEFRIYQHNLSRCEGCLQQSQSGEIIFIPRLPALFEHLKALLESLVPDRDQASVAENLDVSLLMQQVQMGTLNVVNVTEWLASLVKNHCAPMRDEMADEMAEKLQEGFSEGDSNTIVCGLTTLFNFLEAMKLDVANHQIRSFRLRLIEDTVAFQQGYFRNRIGRGKIDVDLSRNWYEEMVQSRQNYNLVLQTQADAQPFDALIHGLIKLCTSTSDQAVPETLFHDGQRIRELRVEVQDAIFLQISLKVFNQLVHRIDGTACLPLDSYTKLQLRLMAIINQCDEYQTRDTSREVQWQSQLDDVATEVTRAAFAACYGHGYHVPDYYYQSTSQVLRDFIQKLHSVASAEKHFTLHQMTTEQATHFQKLSALAISEEQRKWQQTRCRDRQHVQGLPDLQDVSRRIAHIAVLHWNIWADLVYLCDDVADQSEDDTSAIPDP